MIELKTVQMQNSRTQYIFFTSRTKIPKGIIIGVLENENKGKVEVSWDKDIRRCFDNYENAIRWHTFTPAVVAALNYVYEHEKHFKKMAEKQLERETTPEPRTQTQTSP